MNNNETSSIVMSELKSGLKFEEVLKKEKDFLSERGADSNQLIGLAFSGGGIRSSTFNLGVLQALADKKLISCFDYLSTVSGGGYIGAWFSALINRRVLINRNTTELTEAGNITPDENKDAVKDVEEQLLCTSRQTSEPPEIYFLRSFSNYLTPKTGLFSLDTFAAFSVWLTNTVLNQIVLISSIVAIFTVINFFYILPNKWFFTDGQYTLIWLFYIGIFFILFAVYKTLKLIFYQNDNNECSPLSLVLLPAWLGIILCGMYIYDKFCKVPSLICQPSNFSNYLGYSVLLLALGVSFLIILILGLVGRGSGDLHILGWKISGLKLGYGVHEWWSRLSGASFIIGIILGIAVYIAAELPEQIDYLISKNQNPFYSIASFVVPYILSFSLAKVGQTSSPSSDNSNGKFELITKIGPYIAIIVMVVFLGFGTYKLIDFLIAKNIPLLDSRFGDISARLSIIMIAGLLVFIGSRRFDINLFSLHNFYHYRLARCYLGATYKNRKANFFTGFSSKDDMRFANFKQRPLQIINTSLNITAGKELAWQQRKAASFAFTPHFSGFELPDKKGRFQLTEAYNDQQLMTGSLMAVSGAAASPNWGYHTNPAMAFIMTMFNVRLGRWFGNPITKDKWKNQSPRFSWLYLIWELFAQTKHDSNYVYLSDGGHFENLGIYELVRRRCRLIVAIDAGQDSKFTFEDLGNAIRKCYTDFGVRIKVPYMEEDVGLNPSTKMSNKHFTIGEILYKDRYGETVENGILVYIKSSFTGDEPADLKSHKKQNSEFPHDSTVDQCFDETQFESYRNLGYHIAESVFVGVPITNHINCEMLIQAINLNYCASKKCDEKALP